eukprot:COSAG01_NODE_8568_length_2737_cov_4.139121_3_plen_27_part_01
MFSVVDLWLVHIIDIMKIAPIPPPPPR